MITGRRTSKRLLRGARGDYIQILYDTFGTDREFNVYDADAAIYQALNEHISPQTLRAMSGSGDSWIEATGESKDPSTSAYRYHISRYGEHRILEYRKAHEKRLAKRG